jgi:hypothetical protein
LYSRWPHKSIWRAALPLGIFCKNRCCSDERNQLQYNPQNLRPLFRQRDQPNSVGRGPTRHVQKHAGLSPFSQRLHSSQWAEGFLFHGPEARRNHPREPAFFFALPPSRRGCAGGPPAWSERIIRTTRFGRSGLECSEFRRPPPGRE